MLSLYSFSPERVVCIIAPENAASIRVADKCGFRQKAQGVYKGELTLRRHYVLSPREARGQELRGFQRGCLGLARGAGMDHECFGLGLPGLGQPVMERLHAHGLSHEPGEGFR